MKNLRYIIVATLLLMFTACQESKESEKVVSVTTEKIEEEDASHNGLKDQPSLTPQEVTKSVAIHADIKGNSIEINWDYDSSARAYYLEWGETAELVGGSEYLSEDKRLFLHKGLEYATIYYYRLSVEYKSGEIKYSNTLQVKTAKKENILQTDEGF